MSLSSKQTTVSQRHLQDDRVNASLVRNLRSLLSFSCCTYDLTTSASSILKNDGDDASLSSFPITEWKTTGNFGFGKNGEERYVLMVELGAHCSRSPA